MPSTPAITTGIMLFMTISGECTPMEEMPTPALPVPYAEPTHDIESAAVAPPNPSAGAQVGHMKSAVASRVAGGAGGGETIGGVAS